MAQMWVPLTLRFSIQTQRFEIWAPAFAGASG